MAQKKSPPSTPRTGSSKRRSPARPGKRRSNTRKAKPVTGRSRQIGLLLGKLALAALVLLGVWLVYLDALITRQFEGKKWALPAKVYAQPIELYPGAELDIDSLQAQLKRQGYLPVRRLQHPGTFSRSANRLHVYSRDFLFPDGQEPARQLRIEFSGNRITRLSDLQGRPQELIRLDPQLIGGIYPASFEDRILVKLDEVPEFLVQALVAVEDRGFYDHAGVSVRGISRAMLANIKAGRFVQGGSTLTQQLVKNFYLTNRRSLWRKLQELPMALLLEFHYSKEEILESYLNEVFLGQQGRLAIHGFGMASQFYFAQPVSELSPARAALLVALVKGASYYNPHRQPERALERRNLVLDIMAEQGIISRQAALQAQRQPLGVVPEERLRTNSFPAYLDLVRRQLQRDYREEDLTSEGLQIFTHMDPLVQQQAQSAIAQTLKQLGDRALETAMVVTQAQTGDVLALIGGRNSGYAGFNRALDARRAIGSLVKPAVYLTALAHAERYSLASLIDDSPLTLNLANGNQWSPRNFDRQSHGQIPLYRALAKSYNIATARLGMELGLDAVYRTLYALGAPKLPDPVPASLLGALPMTPLEVTQIYQTIASGGFRMPLRAIRSVQTREGELLTRYSLEVEETVDPRAMHLLHYALQGVMHEGTGRSAYNQLPRQLNLAGKTGTSNDNRDSWFAGFSQDRLAVVWMGHDDNSPTRLTGSSGALRAWTRFMGLSQNQPLQGRVPEGIEYHWIDADSGLASSRVCSGSRELPFIAGSEPDRRVPCAETASSRVVDWLENWLR